MIDRNCDATILAGASDRRLASKVLEYARSTRERLNIRSSDFDLGALLHHDIPFLAMVAGSTLRDSEKTGNPHLAPDHPRSRSIADSARHVMRSTAFANAMPGNCLLSDPVRGNAAAVLVDRVAALAGVPRTGDDGPCDMLAKHMLSSAGDRGRTTSVQWSPGWPDAEDDPGADVRAYARRVFALDDRQLAAEMLEQARDARIRLGIPDGPSPHAVALWQTIPAMSALFGAVLEPGEGAAFRRSAAQMNDQEIFDMASGLVASVIDSSDAVGSRAPIGDRAFFSHPAQGNTMAILLDRAARHVDAERGGPGDLTGLAIATARTECGQSPGCVWQPEETARKMMAVALMSQARSGNGF